MRSFARDLGVDSGFLSRILKGSRRLSLSKAHSISDKLSLSAKDRERFLYLVRLALIDDDEDLKRSIERQLQRHSEPQSVLGASSFKVISKWYHYAILELTFKEDFESQPSYISQKLNISQFEAKMAIERMVRLGLLARDSNGSLKKTKSNIGDLCAPSESARCRHKDILEKASRSLEKQSFEEKVQLGATFCIDKKLLPETRQRIQVFLQDLNDFLESGDREEVYEMNVSLFSLEK
ncbi:TIGR02147 family protein [Pseudobacteriovorax antillogorgiicola]|uniref:TIGR02147 family protein n=2 Tax=Pseudobacteriovorax antillogorgiicola TaxID=1513793 RepID=A0A1Y6CKJ8_9BACT|nr:uncharacterized protein (TIGR02147 family) [Pseudobacteriovorax antillogorgiicola]SMF71265.1 TIGR02147 family protein [Pseudobacteriovorax antillogorgiicola]